MSKQLYGNAFWLRLEDLKADVICSAGLQDPGRKTSRQSAKTHEWSGRG